MRIKSAPEDFVVEEISGVEFRPSGAYAYFWLRKRNMTTLACVDAVASFLGIPLQRVGVAGNKDKVAVTSQLCSVPSGYAERLKGFRHDKMSVELAGFGDHLIATGVLKGNHFKILVRDAQVPKKKEWFVNFFGEQRFSSANVEIGRAILKREFSTAIKFIMRRDGRQKRILKQYLDFRPADVVGALRCLPEKVLHLVVHSYQSWLWNEVVREIVREPSDVVLPMAGFGFEGSEEVLMKYEVLLEKDGLSFESFVISALPELSVESVSRQIWIRVRDLKMELRGSDVFLEFSLPKGSYATEVVRQLFSHSKSL